MFAETENGKTYYWGSFAGKTASFTPKMYTTFEAQKIRIFIGNSAQYFITEDEKVYGSFPNFNLYSKNDDGLSQKQSRITTRPCLVTFFAGKKVIQLAFGDSHTVALLQFV